MWQNALGSDTIKNIVSLGTELIKLVDTLGLIPSILLTIAAVKTGKFFLPKAWAALSSSIKTSIAAMSGEAAAIEALNGAKVKAAIMDTTSISNDVKEAAVKAILTGEIGKETIATNLNTVEKIRDALATKGVTGANAEAIISALGLSGANVGLAASFKTVGSSALLAAKAIGTFLISNPVGWAILAVSAIGLVTFAMDKLTKSHEDYVEEIKESSDKINEMKDNITNLNKELEETRDKIFDLEHADTLTFTEKEELDRLKKQNAELERTIALEERKKELEEKKRSKAYVNAAKTDTNLNGTTTVYKDENGNYVAASQATQQSGTGYANRQQVLNNGYSKETVSVLEGKIAEEQRAREEYEKAQKEYEDALNNDETSDKELKRLETRLNNTKETYDNASEEITNTLNELEETYGDMEWYPDAAPGSWQEESNKVFKQVFDYYDRLAIQSDTTGKAVESAFNRIAGMGQFDDQIKEIEESAGVTGESLQEMLSFNDDGTLNTAAGGMSAFVQSLIDCGVISGTTAEELQKVVDLTLQTSTNTSNAAVANQKLARSQKILQYYKLYKELNKYTKILKNTRDASGDLINKYKEKISLIKQNMSALAQEISKYDILSDKINEAKSSFEEFENAKTADSDSDYLDKTGEMFQSIISGFQSAEMGSETFKSAFTSLIPESVYEDLDTLTEKYDAAAKYISETLNRYMKVEYDDDGLVKSVETTSKNIETFIEDAKEKGLMSFTDGVWTVNETDFDKFASRMGITKEMLLAIGVQIDKMDSDWIMGDNTSFFDSFDMGTEQNIYKIVQSLSALDQQLIDGKISQQEYIEQYNKLQNELSENREASLQNIQNYTDATKAVDDANAKLDAAKQKLQELKNSDNSDSDEIKLAYDDVNQASKELADAVLAKGQLTAPSQIEIAFAQDYITSQLDALQTQLQTREWFITPTLNDDGTIESELFELGEDGKYQIKANVTIPEEDKSLVDEYLNALNGAKTLGVYLKDENDAQGKAEKLENTVKNVDELLNDLSADIDISDAISALETLKREIDSLKNIKVSVTTEKKEKTGFWDWLTGGETQNQNRSQRNTSNSRQHTRFQGTANASGDWGLPQAEHNSLVGELGMETVVDPHTGRYYTVGDNGAELVDLPKDAIIFNHKQTEALFKNGHINSRGHAYVNGNAYAGTSGTIFTKYGIGSAYGGVVPNYQGYSDVLQHLDTIADTVDDASSDAEDDFEELFDWFEILTTEIDQGIDLIDARIQNTVGAKAQNDLYQQTVELNYAKMAALNNGIVLYSNKAQEFLNQIPAKYKEMAQNGAVALTDFQGEVNEQVLEAIKNYREWKDKAADLNVELENIKKNIADINVQMLENISTEYENKIGLITNLNDRIQNQIDLQTESGERLSENYYTEMVKNAQKALALQKEQRKEMLAQLNSSVASGQIEKYSEEWFDMVNAINDVDDAIVQCQIDIENFQNSINNLHWENFERLVKAIENVSDEAEHLRNLIKDEDLVDDAGNWSADGITALGLAAQEMENAKYRAEMYGKEIQQLKKDYKAGRYSQDEYNEKLQELKSSQWDCIEAYESAQDAIIDLNEVRIDAVKDGIQKEIDAYEELINKRKEDLDAQRDQHDWAKSVKEHTSEIESIQRQIDALNGDTSASAAAQRKKLQEELAKAQEELEETYYDREIELQQKALDETLEMYKEGKEDAMAELDEYLTHEKKVLSDSYDVILANSDVVYKKLNEMAQEYNIEILNSVVDPWNKGNAALGTYGDNLQIATSGYVAQLKLIESELENIQRQADRTADSLIDMVNAQSEAIQSAGSSGSSANISSNTGSTFVPTNGYSSNSGNISVGSTVTVSPNATNFSRDGGNGTHMQSWVPGSSFTVMQVSGDEVLIGRNGGYTGWVKKSDLVGYGSSSIIYGYTSSGEKYSIGSSLGQDFVYNARRGDTMTGSDGSIWVKNSDGSVTIKKNGKSYIVAASYSKYAKGTTGVKNDELAWIDEHGLEEIVMHADGGKLAYLTKGSSVIPHDISENLMKLGSVDYRTILDNNRPEISAPYMISNNMEVNLEFGSLLHVDTVDQDTLPEVQKMVRNEFNNMMKQLNSGIKKYSRG